MSPASVSNTQPRPRAFRTVRRCAGAVCLVPFTYALLGLLALSAPNYEVFPFFSWFLFPVTPATVTRFGVQIQHPGGDSTTNRWYEQDTSLGVARRSMDAQVLIQALGSAVERKALVSVHQVRSTFEGNFLPPSCRYALFKCTYDPVKRWLRRDDETSSEYMVASFECGKP